MSLIFTPAQAISLASPNPGSARNPHVLKYAPVAVRWRYPV
ncbi:hypothetical protein ECPA5_3293 [Escherichia coli PA5]|nr:hypothetical protein ECH7EC4206_A1602 [Escherichia coli O157:H7 str. EC4206]EHV20718.1 hypothetical protein ECDEC4F_3116 [Escherichia coli DEC4F]EIN23331.1 hypothetical protein ECFDA505_3256 [Escherichia coli FDA505]EIN56753.1 hypothetical protein ECPA5_3293 [Escherichia coli PA5]EIP10547.1 hypothetical protein ECTW14313_3226 [Escherichia coli O157:H7 str. TW14313]EKH16684.1 hypothetical protein ECFDA507_3441 [Escherichia coli FDA507]EKW13357.1 hypothetical protein EC940618_3167 [Escherich